MDSKLYVVATPLGNRSDITERAVETLKACRVIFAEDTREARKLLEILKITATGKTLHSYAAHNMKEATSLATTLLEEGFDIALVSDRGTPAISDPGARLVAEVRELGHAVVPIPGPSALASLWSVSGLTEKEHAFIGFMPEAAKERSELLETIRRWNRPVVFFESPRRIRATFEKLKTVFPQGKLFLGREMTKLHEEFTWLSLADAKADDIPELGEFSCVLIPAANAVTEEEGVDEAIELRTCSDKEWSKKIAAKTGRPAKEIYNALQSKKTHRETQL